MHPYFTKLLMKLIINSEDFKINKGFIRLSIVFSISLNNILFNISNASEENPRTSLRTVFPSPKVVSDLYMDFKRQTEKTEKNFGEYLKKEVGNFVTKQNKNTPLISLPKYPIIKGRVHVKVLLVDFEDRPGTLKKERYEDLLFAKNRPLIRSMFNYYDEVSSKKVNIEGSVHGWFRMPKSYSYYVDGKSGLGEYPKNGQKMAEDAVKLALENDVKFNDKDIDLFGNKKVTALFLRKFS